MTSKMKDKHTYTDGKGKRLDLWKRPEDQQSQLKALATNGAYRVKGKDPLGSGNFVFLVFFCFYLTVFFWQFSLGIFATLSCPPRASSG